MIDEQNNHGSAGNVVIAAVIALAIGVTVGFVGTSVYAPSPPQADPGQQQHPKPVIVAPGGHVRGNGYDVLVSATRRDTGYTEDSGRAKAMAYVLQAPNERPFGLSCIAMNAKGALVGAGGFDGLRKNFGAIGRIDFADPVSGARVRCRVIEHEAIAAAAAGDDQ
jgi:hypothetical protein